MGIRRQRSITGWSAFRNKHRSKRLKVGGGSGGKSAVMEIKDRESNRITARPVDSANQDEAVKMWSKSVDWNAKVFTDESQIYNPLPNHRKVNHSRGEYVRGKVHTNGIESFWSLFKRGYFGTYHKMSPKHLHRYVAGFTGRHGIRCLDTIDQMHAWVASMIGKRLMYKDLVA